MEDLTSKNIYSKPVGAKVELHGHPENFYMATGKESGTLDTCWKSVSGARAYLVQFRKVGTESFESDVTTQAGIRLTGLQNAAEYEVRVAAVTSSGKGCFCPSLINHAG